MEIAEHPAQAIRVPARDEVAVNARLADDLKLKTGDWLVVRVDTTLLRPQSGLFQYRKASDLTRVMRLRVTQVVANKTMYNARWESRWALLRANGYSDVADKEQATVKLVDPNGPPGSI